MQQQEQQQEQQRDLTLVDPNKTVQSLGNRLHHGLVSSFPLSHTSVVLG